MTGVVIAALAVVLLWSPALVPAGMDVVRRPLRPGPAWEGLLLGALVLGAVGAGVHAVRIDTPTWAVDAWRLRATHAFAVGLGFAVVAVALMAAGASVALVAARVLVAEPTRMRPVPSALAVLAGVLVTATTLPYGAETTATVGMWAFAVSVWGLGTSRDGDARVDAARWPAAALLLVSAALAAMVGDDDSRLLFPGAVLATLVAASAIQRALAPGIAVLGLAFALMGAVAGMRATHTDVVRRHDLRVPLAVDLAGTPSGVHVWSDPPACIETDEAVLDAIELTLCTIPRTAGWGGAQGPPVWRVFDPDAPASSVDRLMFAALRLPRADGTSVGRGLYVTAPRSGTPVVRVRADEPREDAHRRLVEAAAPGTGLTVEIETAGRTVQDVVSVCLSGAGPPDTPHLACVLVHGTSQN